MQIEPEDIGLAAQGVLVKEGSAYGRKGHWDVFDWIGANHYPYVPDFIEEGRAYGFSRRIPKSAPVHLLNKDSLHIIGHPRAILMNYKPFYDARDEMLATCPKDHDIHNEGVAEESCLGLLWEAVGQYDGKVAGEYFDREFPAPADKLDQDIPLSASRFSYEVRSPIEEPVWQFGLFMTLRITAFEVIEDPASDRDEEAMKFLEESGTNIPYYLVEN